jgi:hypothetical protein
MANYYNKYSDAEILAALDATGHDEMEAAAAILVSRGVEVDASGLLSFFGKKKKGAATATDTPKKPKSSLLEKARRGLVGQNKADVKQELSDFKLKTAQEENMRLQRELAEFKKTRDVSGKAKNHWY